MGYHISVNGIPLNIYRFNGKTCPSWALCQLRRRIKNAFCNLVRVESQLKEKNMHVVAQMAENLPAVQETWAPSLGQEDLLEKRMDSHSSVLAWRMPWTEEPAGLQSMGSQKVGTTKTT